MAAAPPAGSPESIGALLTRLRMARGLSQLQLAELLCAAAATPTITRHEISRWEREARVPGPYWLRWLAAVLEAPLPQLESAAAQAADRSTPSPARGVARFPPVLSAADLLSALETTDGADLPALAHAWLVNPPEPAAVAAPPPRRSPPSQPFPPATAGALLQALRRTDDLMGGTDLAPRVAYELHALLASVRGTRPDRATWRLVAGWAQLAGWVYADGGDPRRASGAYRAGLHAAVAAADRLLAAHILGSISHLYASTGDPASALLLARTALAGVRHNGCARLRALLHHRVAFAAAHAGERRVAHAALAAAERVADRIRTDGGPEWLYWLDHAELAAMTGRCLAALGRPVRAAPLLAAARADVGARTVALDDAWLARTYLELGEVERACQVAATGWRGAIRAGSARVATLLRQLHPRLLRHRDLPAVRGYERLVYSLRDYLPEPWQQPAAASAAPPTTRLRAVRRK